jgi:hypothetical protein
MLQILKLKLKTTETTGYNKYRIQYHSSTAIQTIVMKQCRTQKATLEGANIPYYR